MNFKLTSFIIVFLAIVFSANAQVRDTVKVRTIEYQETRAGWFTFPEIDESIDKVYMNYTLKCPPGKPCGEWDYITFVEVWHHYLPNYSINKSSPDTTLYMSDTSYSYKPIIEGGVMTGLDSTAKESMTLAIFDLDNPSETPVETREVWPIYYKYEFDNAGVKLDSTLVDGWEMILLTGKTRVAFNNDYTLRESFEIMRYITPYGNGLDLGDGFTWTIDITDYQNFLHGEVYLYAPHGKNWEKPTSQNVYSDLELTFDFVLGTPAREVKRIIPMWNAHPRYHVDFEDYLQPKEFTLIEGETGAKLKVTQTGHGFGGSKDNCAEFCDKKAFVHLNDNEIYSRSIWKECGNNPLYPQGGTWLYDRSNWCPGEDVPVFDYDLTESLIISSANTLDYSMEAYEFVRTSEGSAPNYKIASFLVTYGDYNFQTDAAVRDIRRPSQKDQYLRLNPSCNNPIIDIENNAVNLITSLKIKYGLEGIDETTFDWSGAIDRGETITIELTALNIPEGWEGEKRFYVEILEVNGSTDEYAENNFGETFVVAPPTYYNSLEIKIKTNDYSKINADSPYDFKVDKTNGENVFVQNQTNHNKEYTRNIPVGEGSYEFYIRNYYGYGLGFWVLAQQYGLAPGYMQFVENESKVHSFQVDFGNDFRHGFFVKNAPQLESNVTTTIDFEKVAVDDVKYYYLYLYPANDEGLIISNVEITKLADSYFIDSLSHELDEPVNLAVQDTMTVKIGFSPKTKGIKLGSLDVTSNSMFDKQMSFSLRGVGSDETSVYPSLVNMSGVEISYFNDAMNFEFDEIKLGNVNVQVFDMTGRSVFTSDFLLNNRNLSVPLMLTSGVYLVQIENAGKLTVKSIVVAR